MTDIDFDELDRAVNSLMNKQQEAKAPPEVKKETTETPPVIEEKLSTNETTVSAEPVSVSTSTSPSLQSISPGVRPSAQPSPLSPVPTPTAPPSPETAPVADQSPEPSATKEVKPSPAITRRPTGRFMDVVRPAAAANQKPATSVPSRTGISLQPSADLVDVVNMNSNNLATKESQQEIDAGHDNLENIPDLKDVEQNESAFAAIENAPIEEIARNAAVEEQSLTDKVARSLEASNNADSTPTPPLESPFIANVEVEKRPLGAVDQQTSNPEIATEASGSDTEEMKLEHQYNTELADYASDKDVLSDVPDSVVDLNPDIVAIEEAGIPDSPELEDNKDNKATIPSNAPSAGDIPRQYNAEIDAESTNPEPAPMFAAASTEVKSSTGKEKKKSGVLTALLIVLFLAIGVAGGAVSYFLLIK